MRDTLDTMRQTRSALALAALLTGCALAFNMATLVFAVSALEIVAANATIAALLPLGLALLLAIVCSSVADLCIDRCLLRAGLWVDHVLAPRLLRAGLAETDPAATLLDTNRALGGLRDFLVGRDLRTLLLLPWLLGSTAVLGLFEPRLAAVAAGIYAAVGTVAFVGARLLRGSDRLQDAASRVVRRGVVSIAANGHGLVGLGLARHACDVEAAANRSWIAAAFAHRRRLTIAGVAGRSLIAAGEIAIIAIAASLMLAGTLSATTGLVVVVLIARTLSPLLELPTLLLRASAGRQDWRRLADVSLNEAAHRLFDDTQPAAQAVAAPSSARLALKDVDYAYPGSKTPVLRHISLVLTQGSAIVIHGAPGSGKSTLAALLAGGLPPTGGLALLNDSPIRPQQSAISMPNIGWLMQEPILMDGTIAENICRFSNSDPAAAIEAAKRAGVDGVLATLRDGFQTRVGSDGRQLSMRQRRAVALARALYGQPAFLILDEPETMLDETAIAQLAATLVDLKADGTGLCLVTRHPALTALATDEVLIADGRLATEPLAHGWQSRPANDAGAEPRFITHSLSMVS